MDGGSDASPEKAKQTLKEKLQQQVMLHVRKVEQQYEGKVAALEKQLQETKEALANSQEQYKAEHEQLTDALSLMDEYEQGMEGASAAELKALDMETERNAAVEAREQLELKNTILQRKVQNLEKQYNVLQEEKRLGEEQRDLAALDLQEEIVKLREALLEAQESTLTTAVKPSAEKASADGKELAQARATIAALETDLQAANKQVSKAEAYKTEAEELALFVEMLEEDMRALKAAPAPAPAPALAQAKAGKRASAAPQTGEEEKIAELQALYDIGQEELEMTREQLDNVTKLFNLEKRNVTLLARKYKELDKNYRDLQEHGAEANAGTAEGDDSSPHSSDLALELKKKIDQLTERLKEQDAAVKSLVAEKAALEAHYKTSARRMTVELDKYRPGAQEAAEGVQKVAGLPSFDQVSKQLRQLEPSLHTCSWREKAQLLLVMMTTDPVEQKRLIAKVRL